MGNESGELGFGGHTCQVGTEKQRHVECGYFRYDKEYVK